MAIALICGGNTGGQLINASTTGYIPCASSTSAFIGLENFVSCRWQSPGTLAALTVHVPENDRGATTLRLRKNTANGTPLVSIGAGLTGVFQDAVSTEPIVAGDMLNYLIVTGAGGSAFRLSSVSMTFAASTNTITRYQATRDGGFMPSSGTRPLSGDGSGADDSSMPIAGTFKHAAAYLTFNNRSGATTIGIAIAGVMSALAVSVPASTTGTFLDNSNSVAVVANDAVRWNYTAGTSGSIELDLVSVDLETTTSNCAFVSHSIPTAVFAGQSRYGAIAGTTQGLSSISVESQSQVAMPGPGTITSLHSYVTINSASAATAVALRKNAADTAIVISIPALTTGGFSASGSVAVVSHDLMAGAVRPGAGSGEIRVLEFSGGVQAVAAPVVNAGPDQALNFCAGAATLAGSATGEAPITYQWTQDSGPASAVFAASTSPTSTVTFPATGVYVLRLTAANVGGSSADTVTITITNTAPVVNAGPDQDLEWPAVAQLAGSATDEYYLS